MNSSIKLGFGWQRNLLVVPGLLLLIGVTAAFCWFLGNSLADSAQQPEVAAAAVFFAPADPAAHAKLASFQIRSFVPTDLPSALSESEQAASLSPDDYRYWFALTRMRERTGDAEGAERSARRTTQLAPNYAQVLWLEANILLRRGQTAEAFAQMRRAAEADSQFAIHFVNTASQTLATDDLQALRQIVGDAPAIRAALVNYLTQSKKLEAATSVWQELPDREKLETGKDLARTLLDAKKYRAALSFYELTAANEAEKPILGRFLNGGFESEMAAAAGAATPNPFAWQIADGDGQPQIAPFASTKHSGERSLIIIFNSIAGTDFRFVAQTVAAESNTAYHFEMWAKAERLQSGSKFFWEVMDATDGRVIAQTVNVPTGDTEWQRLTTDFKTSNTTEAVTFRFNRLACQQSPCSITGKLWFDDFTLQKTN